MEANEEVPLGGMGVRAVGIAAGQAADSYAGCFWRGDGAHFGAAEWCPHWAAPPPGCRFALGDPWPESCSGCMLPVRVADTLEAAAMRVGAWER